MPQELLAALVTARNKALLAIAALAFSGLVQGLVFPPLNYYWLAPWALAPGFYVLSRLHGRRAFLGGWLMGILANLALFYWIAETVMRFAEVSFALGLVALLLFALFAGLYLGVFGWGLGYLRAVSGAAWPFAAAAWFVTCEFLNPQLFPYYQGAAFYAVPELFLVSSVTGIPGVSFQIVLWNLILVAAAEQIQGTRGMSGRAWVASGLGAALMLGSSTGISAWQENRVEAAEERAPVLRMAIVQPSLDILAARTLGPSGMAERHVEQSRRALSADPAIDVFLWPETALRSAPADPANSAVFDFVGESAREVWTGARTLEQVEGKEKYFNAAYLFHRDGSIGKRYDKVRPLMFGEYVPFEDHLPILRRLPGVGNFAAGDDLVQLDSETPAVASFLICYEAILREFVRSRLPEHTNLIANITNDSWFGNTSCASQHLMLAATRSAELGIPMARAATTGISAFIDARGVITQQSPLYTQETLTEDVRLVRVPSLYSMAGDWFLWLAMLVSLPLLLRGFIRARSSS
ncbi:MAG: apolipoprotein N-acyltransferase [Deltaproteobacteria bacterium]|jgi:apolipoprotein N-acyltransferase|nr:apolipoprotein N-acyltransferase [Deltaproteobacteria bacterium]